jgi:hypothetical protein
MRLDLVDKKPYSIDVYMYIFLTMFGPQAGEHPFEHPFAGQIRK